MRLRKWTNVISISFVFSVLILGFQNCSESVQDLSGKNNLSSTVTTTPSGTSGDPGGGFSQGNSAFSITAEETDIHNCSLSTAKFKILIRGASQNAKGCIAYKYTAPSKQGEAKTCTNATATALSSVAGWSYDSVKKEWSFTTSTKDSSQVIPGNYRFFAYDGDAEVRTIPMAVTNEGGDANNCSLRSATNLAYNIRTRGTGNCNSADAYMGYSILNLGPNTRYCVEIRPTAADPYLCDSDTKYNAMSGSGEWIFNQATSTWTAQYALRNSPLFKPGGFKHYFLDPDSGIRGSTGNLVFASQGSNPNTCAP